jgi:hypothetical protein
LPTNVVTDWAAREAENRAPDTGMTVPAARLELVEVTYGVTDAGHAVPDTKRETCWAPPPFTTTMATVPSGGFVNATTRGADAEGVGAPVTPTRTYPGRTNLLKFPIA